MALYAEGDCLFDEPMARHTTFRIGGPAECYVIPQSTEQLAKTIVLCREQGVPYYVIGNGSNLLVADEGISGVVIRMETKNASIRYDILNGIPVAIVPAGMLLSAFAKELSRKGYANMEYATGIPGTVGGGVVMNAGAYGGEIKDSLLWAKVLTKAGGELCLSVEELQLSYRHSCISENGYIVTEAAFRLEKGDVAVIEARVAELTKQRKDKQPLEYPSAGSTFKRPEGYFAGKLIDDCGLRGFSVGGAQVSEKHCGFVINQGGATAEDVVSLIRQVRERVSERFGVTLEPEVRFLGDFSKK